MPYSSPSAPRVDGGQLASMQQAIQRHPQVAALLRSGNTAGAEYYIRTHRDEFGFDLPAGYRLQPSGQFQYTATTNQDHWYSDPRILGPAAVAAGGGLGLLAGPASAGGAGAAAGTSAPLGGLTPAMTASAPAIASQGVSASVGAGAGAGAGTLANVGKNLLGNLTSANGIASLAPLIASLAASGGGGGNGGTNNEFLQGAYADAKRQNAMHEARYRRVDPLHQAVSQLAFSRMPISSRQGITMNQVPLPEEQ